ncbi:methionyl-tRNA formyltransferase [Mycoplasmopsis hyopharyngis]|uniref:methionyl-tRNA formyltransferase n=1 Tax=Mycoplasmopsis hyopharyngis TaxID=29558 RepID=UPI0038738C7F
MIKILLAGTPEFSVPIFEAIINCSDFEVVGIVSQPDKQANRNYQIVETPTKTLAKKYNIKCFQPTKIKEIYDELTQLNYDYLITCAFGQIIPESVLNIAKKDNINIHGSLLPKYRGASPIQYALLNGDEYTGVSIIRMVKAMDAGNILVQSRIDIDENETASTLFKKFDDHIVANINNWIKQIDNKQIVEIEQNEDQVSFCKKLLKEDALLDLENKNAQEIIQIIKAFEANPGAYTFVDGKRLKVYLATTKFVKNTICLKCKDKEIYLLDYQFESKKRIKKY